MQLMFTMTIGEVKNFTSLDLMAGRVPHELPGGDPCGRVPPGRVPTVDVLHRTGSDLFGPCSRCVGGRASPGRVPNVDVLHRTGSAPLGRDPGWASGRASIRTSSDYVVLN
mgnify:CR=1 FL=1